MEKETFVRLVEEMTDDRAQFCGVVDTYSAFSDHLREVLRLYESIDSADWVMPGSNEAVDKKVKEQTREFFAENKSVSLSKILSRYDLSAICIGDYARVGPLSDLKLSPYYEPGTEFFDRLVDHETKYMNLISSGQIEIEKIIAGLPKSFRYDCCRSKERCSSCNTFAMFEGLRYSADLSKTIMGYFFKQKKQAILDDYPIEQWSGGVNLDSYLRYKEHWGGKMSLDDRLDTIKLLVPESATFLRRDYPHLALSQEKGSLTIILDLKNFTQVNECYTLFESVKDRTYSAECVKTIRGDLAELLELVNTLDYLQDFTFTRKNKYTADSRIDSEAAGLSELIADHKETIERARVGMKKKIDDKRTYLRTTYGILDARFAIETTGDEYEYRCGKGFAFVKFLRKEFTSCNDMAIIKKARDYLRTLVSVQPEV